jgi:hypothetical protein
MSLEYARERPRSGSLGVYGRTGGGVPVAALMAGEGSTAAGGHGVPRVGRVVGRQRLLEWSPWVSSTCGDVAHGGDVVGPVAG